MRHSRHLERLSLPLNADSSLRRWRSREGGPALLARAHRGRPGTLSGFQRQRFSGGLTEGATPDPISNSEVKTFRADGTAGETLWESRSPPGIILSPEPTNQIVGSGLFYCPKSPCRAPSNCRAAARSTTTGGTAPRRRGLAGRVVTSGRVGRASSGGCR